MTSAPIDPLLGRTLNERYVIRSRIARGGMAMVYLATDLRLERKVAVKVMHEHLAEDENFTRRFDREARSAARLAHANLVNVFDQGHDLGRSYLVMEYLPNITLRQLLKKQKRLTLDQALEISEAVLGGLAAAHSAGIVHRDLKPENVLLVDDGRIKIGDFGLARAVSANTTTGQALLGTIAYLSPELVTRGIADERSDLYAFGIMLYEMLTGVQPFVGEQPMQIAYQHANSEVPAPSEHSQVSTPAVDEFVLWLTQRDAARRPTDAGEAFEHLHAIRRDPYGPPSGVLGGPEDTGEPLAATTVLPPLTADDDETTFLTPSTSILDPVQSSAIADSGTTETGKLGAAAPTAVDRARGKASRRSKRGKVIAAIVVVLVALAAGLGYWFGQGPGSRVTVPDLTGVSMADAQTELEALDLVMEATTCSSLTVEAGLAAGSEPTAGSRLDRGETVAVCESTGPELLDVPTIVGLSLEDAQQVIEDANFTFGEVTDTRFSDADEDSVLAALDGAGEPLGDTYQEQGVVNLVVSAGQIPSVTGQTVENATSTLSNRRLNVDASFNTEAYSDEIAEGLVIAVIPSTDPVRPGDAVGLQISLGPELFEVPNIEDMALQDAIDAINAAGFTATWSPVFDAPGLRRSAIATGTNPKAGSMVELGTEVYITGSIFG